MLRPARLAYVLLGILQGALGAACGLSPAPTGRSGARADAGVAARVAVDAALALRRPLLADATVEPPLDPLAAVLAETQDGSDVVSRVRETERVLFCSGRTVDDWCRAIDAAIAGYRKEAVAPTRAWLAEHPLPEPMPDTVLYPFAGGDLVAVLNVLPRHRHLVLVSLEQAGLPRPLHQADAATIWEARLRYGRAVEKFLAHGISYTRDLEQLGFARLPGILPYLLLGLRVHGGGITGLRYLSLEPDGRLRGLDRKALEDGGLDTPWNVSSGPMSPRRRKRFAHVEVRFRLPGDRADRVVRHLDANLANAELHRVPGLLPYLARLGPRVLVLKASSYLLWSPAFSRIRDAVFAGATRLVADPSAPDPAWLRRLGFSLQVFGRFTCKVVDDFRWYVKPWAEEFARQAPPELPFRFGYRDCNKQNALIIGKR
jgi:hypothetical protein